MTTKNEPRAIVFDIGMVLVDLAFGELFDFLRARGVTVNDARGLAENLQYERYETGELSDDDVYRGVLSLAREPFPFSEWADAWTSILTPNEKMLAMADRLAASYPVSLLSNTNTLHFEYMQREFRLRDRFRHVVTSFEAGAMKPDAAIYAYAEQQIGLSGQALVFFDDREENVAAARAAGWTALRFEGYATTLAQLQELGFDPQLP